MKKLKTKIYQSIANQIYDKAKSLQDNPQVFNLLISFGYQLDYICSSQGIYLD